MAIELGVLLGASGGGQSLESVGSWAAFAGLSSLTLQANDVHSSGGGGLATVASGTPAGSRVLSYPYAADFAARASPDVASHRLVALVWVRVDGAAASGQVLAVWTGATAVPVPFAAGVQPIRLDAPAVVSGQALALDFQVASAVAGSLGLYVDDVTVYLDAINPGADADKSAVSEELQAPRSATLGGLDAVWNWSRRPRFSLPAPWLPASMASLLNWWARNTHNLLLNLDTSDTAARFLVRVGGSPPATRPHPAYADAFAVPLALEGVSEDLVF